MHTLAVLPVKRFTAAKQRLAEGLEPWTREDLPRRWCATS